MLSEKDYDNGKLKILELEEDFYALAFISFITKYSVEVREKERVAIF